MRTRPGLLATPGYLTDSRACPWWRGDMVAVTVQVQPGADDPRSALLTGVCMARSMSVVDTPHMVTWDLAEEPRPRDAVTEIYATLTGWWLDCAATVPLVLADSPWTLTVLDRAFRGYRVGRLERLGYVIDARECALLDAEPVGAVGLLRLARAFGETSAAGEQSLPVLHAVQQHGWRQACSDRSERLRKDAAVEPDPARRGQLTRAAGGALSQREAWPIVRPGTTMDRNLHPELLRRGPTDTPSLLPTALGLGATTTPREAG